MALLQISTRCTALLFDLITLLKGDSDGESETSRGQEERGGQEDLRSSTAALLGLLLASDRVIKLGYGLASDIRRLASSYVSNPNTSLPLSYSLCHACHVFYQVPACLCRCLRHCVSFRYPDLPSLSAARHVVDFNTLKPESPTSAPSKPTKDMQGVKAAAGMPLSHSAAESSLPPPPPPPPLVPIVGRGLSNLVESVLGRPLDKSMQTSDWQRRPLTRGQVQYAAMDAFCLVAVYQQFKERNPGLLPAPVAIDFG